MWARFKDWVYFWWLRRRWEISRDGESVRNPDYGLKVTYVPTGRGWDKTLDDTWKYDPEAVRDEAWFLIHYEKKRRSRKANQRRAT